MVDRGDAMREELGRVLASEAFLASPMLSAFLSFVVEETLAGREDRLKAYAIAVGALGRPDDFDANENPLVRVQARRLRQALRRHYEARGDDAAPRLDLPIGTYVPVLLEGGTSVSPLDGDEADPGGPDGPSEAEPETAAPAVDAPPPHAGGVVVRRWLLLAMPVVLAIGVGLGVLAGRWRAPPIPPSAVETGSGLAHAEQGPVVSPAPRGERRNLDASRVLPLLVVEVEVRNAALFAFDGEIFRNRIESFAQRFDDTVVVSRRSPDFPAPIGQPLYRLHFLVERDGATTNLHFRLLHSGDERVVRSGRIALQEAPADAGAPSPGNPNELDVVRDIVQLHGAITQDVANLEDPSPELACLARAWHYFAETSPDTREAAQTCLEAVVVDDPRLAPALTMLGGLLVDEGPPRSGAALASSLARAEDLLRRAIRVAPTSSAPYRMLQNLLLVRGDVAAALLAGTRAVDLDREDMNAVGGHGSLLARIGRYAEALPHLKRATQSMNSPPKWLQFYTFLALNNLGRAEEADRQVAFFEGSHSSLFLTAVAIRAHRRGDESVAADALAGIAAAEPDFGADPRAFLRRRGFVDPVIDRLMADLPSLAPPR